MTKKHHRLFISFYSEYYTRNHRQTTIFNGLMRRKALKYIQLSQFGRYYEYMSFEIENERWRGWIQQQFYLFNNSLVFSQVGSTERMKLGHFSVLILFSFKLLTLPPPQIIGIGIDFMLGTSTNQMWMT